MLTSEEKNLLEYWSGAWSRRRDLAAKLGHANHHSEVGVLALDSRVPDVQLAGVGHILEDLAEQASLRMYSINCTGGVLEPPILVVREFWPTSYGGFRQTSRSVGQVRMDVMSAIDSLVSDATVPVTIVADPMADGRVFVPTARDYNTLLCSKAISRVKDLSMAVSLNGNSERFSYDQVKASESLTTIRRLGENWTHCEVVAGSRPEDVVEVLRDLEQTWSDYMAPRRRRYESDPRVALDSLRGFVNRDLNQFTDEIDSLYRVANTLIDADPNRLVVVFADSWHFDTDRFVQSCLEDCRAVIEYVPVLYQKESK